MPELDRVLGVLLHDLRSPLSVASGYVRLLRHERLDTPEAQDRAWTQTVTALSRLAQLCEEAEQFLPSAEGGRRPVSARSLADRIGELCRDKQLTLEPAIHVSAEGLVLKTPANPEQLAEAVATVLCAQLVPGANQTARTTIDRAQRRLDFIVPLAAAPQDPCDADFDPWQSHGLALPLACHIISVASGSVRTSHELAVSFPLEDPPS